MTEPARERGRACDHVALHLKRAGQFGHGDVRLGLDAPDQKGLVGGQLPVPARAPPTATCVGPLRMRRHERDFIAEPVFAGSEVAPLVHGCAHPWDGRDRTDDDELRRPVEGPAVRAAQINRPHRVGPCPRSDRRASAAWCASAGTRRSGLAAHRGPRIALRPLCADRARPARRIWTATSSCCAPVNLFWTVPLTLPVPGDEAALVPLC